MRKLDIFNHIYPAPFFERFMAVAPTYKAVSYTHLTLPTIYSV